MVAARTAVLRTAATTTTSDTMAEAHRQQPTNRPHRSGAWSRAQTVAAAEQAQAREAQAWKAAVTEEVLLAACDAADGTVALSLVQKAAEAIDKQLAGGEPAVGEYEYTSGEVKSYEILKNAAGQLVYRQNGAEGVLKEGESDGYYSADVIGMGTIRLIVAAPDKIRSQFRGLNMGVWGDPVLATLKGSLQAHAPQHEHLQDASG